MASRVNVRFVVILAVVLGMVFTATAGVFIFIKVRSGARYVRLGDEAAARGDMSAADDFYARAVAKDRTNVEYLKKWRGTMVQKVPDTDTKFVNEYTMYTRGILNSLATLQHTDVQAQCDYLQALYDEHMAIQPGARAAWESLIDEATRSLSFFQGEQPLPIRRLRGMATTALVGMPRS